MISAQRLRLFCVPAVLTLGVIALWGFPVVWYTTEGAAARVWFTQSSEVPGWTFEEVPISEAAERILVADRTVNGEFRNSDGTAVRVFSATRYIENPNEIGLFVHTPDRCWVEGGWRIESSTPNLQEITLNGTRIPVERRIFSFGASRELVYFCGFVDGQVLPYRLDHNLSSGIRKSLQGGESSGTLHRASDIHFWQRLWTTFASRRQLSGPKQFIRLSTPLQAEDVASADARLQKFLTQWLIPGNYASEHARFLALREQD